MVWGLKVVYSLLNIVVEGWGIQTKR